MIEKTKYNGERCKRYYLDTRPIINSLYIRYNNNIIDYLNYLDEDKNQIETYLKSNSSNINYWSIKYNKIHKNQKIVSSYMTKDNIDNMLDKEGIIRYYPGCSNYLLTFNNKEILLDFSDYDKEFDIYEFDNTTYKILKVKNQDDIIEYHYIDNTIYFIYNSIKNTETLYKDNQCIVYKFNDHDLSKSDYLQYHNPVEVTNYDTNKQYIIKYDNYGIMKSMIEISDPETELCDYSINDTLELFPGDKEINSIHPDIYNSFDRSALQTKIDNINGRQIHESFIISKTYNIYKRNTIVVE